MLPVKKGRCGSRLGAGCIAGVLVEMNGLPMSGAPYIGATPSVAAPPSHEAAPSSAASLPVGGAPKPSVPAPAPAPSTTLPPSFPVSVQFDQQTQRFFIEAKDASGLVVFQLPFKSAGTSPSGAASSETRGQRVNSKA